MTATEYSCLGCEERYTKPDHECPAGGGICKGTLHFDFCPVCKRKMTQSFEEQLAEKSANENQAETKRDGRVKRPKWKDDTRRA